MTTIQVVARVVRYLYYIIGILICCVPLSSIGYFIINCSKSWIHCYEATVIGVFSIFGVAALVLGIFALWFWTTETLNLSDW